MGRQVAQNTLKKSDIICGWPLTNLEILTRYLLAEFLDNIQGQDQQRFKQGHCTGAIRFPDIQNTNKGTDRCVEVEIVNQISLPQSSEIFSCLFLTGEMRQNLTILSDHDTKFRPLSSSILTSALPSLHRPLVCGLKDNEYNKICTKIQVQNFIYLKTIMIKNLRTDGLTDEN